MSPPDIITANTPEWIDAFIRFPWTIYQDDRHWVPPLIRDMKYLLQGRRHPFHEYGNITPFIALRDGEICGRIAAIENPLHNQQYSERAGFFGFFECVNDPLVAKALFQQVNTHLANKGLDHLYGPANPSSNYEYGLLVDGFKDSPRLMMTYNPPYYHDLMLAAGLNRAKQLYAWRFSYEKTHEVDRLEAIALRAKEMHGFSIKKIRGREINRHIDAVKTIYNRSWEANWGHVPFTNAEIDLMARELGPILDPSLTLMAFQGEKPVGVAIAVRDLNFSLKKINGRLHILNQLRLLWEKQRIDWVRILILGVLPEYRRKGLDALLYHELVRSAGKLGIKYGEGSWILEDNDLMNRALKALNGTIYKRYNVYEKKLEN